MASDVKVSFEEFIVDSEQVSQITRAKTKIERMHEVKIKLKEEAKKENKQWIRVEGDMRDRMNAREYIIAMCQPCETYELPFDASCREFLHEENLEEIEKQTNACIEIRNLNMLNIKGSDLAVTLAISSLENIIGQSNVETDGVVDSQTGPRHKMADGPSDWEKRLDSTFSRALSKASDGYSKFDDYHNSSTEVKMTILKCLNNVENLDENELFEGSTKNPVGSTALHPIIIYGDDDEHEKRDEPMEVDNLSEQLTETIISPRKQTSVKQAESEAVKFLRTFGTSAGYSDDIIDDGLMYVDDKTAPCDFLDILKQLKSSKKTDHSEVPPDVSEETKTTENKSSTFPPPPSVPSDENGQSRRSLPKEYKKTLVMHMMAEEGGEMSVTELKKQNEERQKILKEQFESPSKQDSPRDGKSRRKKKNKKKNKKVNQNNNLVTADNKTDQDETCVLKAWNSSSDDEDADDCLITDVVAPTVPTYVQPRQLPPPNPFPPTQRQPNEPQYNYHGNLYPISRPEVNVKLDGPGNNFPTNQSLGPRELRYIVIDGSNVAMHHGRGKIFSCLGIKICVEYFLKRGHRKITCFVPAWRRYRPRFQNPISDQEILVELNEKGWLEFTPARRLENKLISSYDDRYVVELAETVDGIIVSNDQYRDLMGEKASWKKIIEERLLQYNFIGDNFMVPHDPLGRDGPKLDEFLSKSSKYPSPNRKRHLSPPDSSGQTNYWNSPPPPLMEQPSLLGPYHNWQHRGPAGMVPNQFQPQNQGQFQNNTRFPWNNQGQSQNRLPANPVIFPTSPRYQVQNSQGQGQCRYPNQGPSKKKNAGNHKQQEKPRRTLEKTQELVKALEDVFPDSKDKIQEVVDNHPAEVDLMKLSNYVINAIN